MVWGNDRWMDTTFESQELFHLCCPLPLSSASWFSQEPRFLIFKMRQAGLRDELYKPKSLKTSPLELDCVLCALGSGAVLGSTCCFSELYQILWHTHLPGPTPKSKDNTPAWIMARRSVRLCPEHIGDSIVCVCDTQALGGLWAFWKHVLVRCLLPSV